MIPDAATEHEAAQERLTLIVTRGLRKAWRQMLGRNWERTWQSVVGPQVVELVTEAQQTVAAQSEAYMTAVLAELGIPSEVPTSLNVPNFAGVAGDGRPVDSLMYGAVVTAAKAQYKPRMSDLTPARVEQLALAEAEAWMDEVATTIMADTARAAEAAALAQRPWVDGWVRMIESGACSRCVTLAGKYYLHNEGFLRHERCKCRHIPYVEDMPHDVLTNPNDYFESLTRFEQDRVFTAAGAEAIRLGADISQVVNARRGMNTAQRNPRGWIPKGRMEAVLMYGHDAFVTTEGVTKQGIYGKGRGNKPVRLMPESIVTLGRNREDIIRLLRLYGYLLDR